MSKCIAYMMDSLSHSLNESTINTVKDVELFLRKYDPQESLEPRKYEVSSRNMAILRTRIL